MLRARICGFGIYPLTLDDLHLTEDVSMLVEVCSCKNCCICMICVLELRIYVMEMERKRDKTNYVKSDAELGARQHLESGFVVG
uniref:Ovule protein n=1 Tax=Syphacia muris TaxID=451379 RepID=A0A0N5B049_9BILA